MRSPNAVAALIRDAGRRAASDEPLGRAVYDGLRRLREEPRGERLHTIVARCDLAGESHKSVAADLAISRRQFYRDLEAGRRRVAELMEEVPPAEDDRALGDWRFAASISLADAGKFDAAGLLVPSGFKEGSTGEESPWALIGRAQALQGSGQAAPAASLLERCVTQISLAHDMAPLAADVRSFAYTLLTFCYFELGKLREAAAAHALNPAFTPGTVSTLARKQYLNIDAMLACDGKEGTGRAKAICIAFHRFAVEHGFIEEIASSLVLLSSIARHERRYHDAERLARESLTLYEAMQVPVAPIVSMLTGIAIDRGDAQAGLELARETKSLASEGSHAWWSSYLFEAEAANLLGKPRAALRMCAMVERDAGTSAVRILSWTRRIQAASFALAGETMAARRAAENALEVAGPDGPVHQRLKNLLVAQRLSPRSAHRDEIEALTALFGLTAPG